MSESALLIKDLTKTYPGGVEALKGVSLDVKKGDFFGLLGPNGAGKTTIIGIVTSLINKSSGAVKVLGNDIDTQLEEAKRHLGIVPQEFNFSIFEKAQDIIIQQAGYYGIPKKLARERAEKYLKQLDLWEKRDTPARNLSGGMKRRLMIARALVHEPDVLFLDEPTAGVDIEIRRSMWEFLTRINKEGKTIILTTHYLEEAENLCRNIAIINHGRIIENTSTKQLLRKLDKDTFILDLKEPVRSLPAYDKHKLEMLDDYTLQVEIPRDHTLNDLFRYLQDNHIEILSMRRRTTKLEELFMDMVRKEDA